MSSFNLVRGIAVELKRNRELLEAYKEIGPPGTFAYTMVKQDIDEALAALDSGDVVAMIRAYQTLKENT